MEDTQMPGGGGTTRRRNFPSVRVHFRGGTGVFERRYRLVTDANEISCSYEVESTTMAQ